MTHNHSQEIHITDMQTYCQCRRKWAFQSQMRMGLQPVTLSAPLFIGQAVHVALEYGYLNSVGGPMTFNESDALEALHSFIGDRRTLMADRVGVLMDTTEKDFEDFGVLTEGIVKHYSMWAHSDGIDEKFILHGTEYQFRVPIPETDLFYCGRLDAFVQGVKSDRYYVIDYKTARSIKNMSGVFRGMQPTTYLWASRQVYDQVDSMLYRALRKRIPDDPIPLKRGGWSKRKNQTTTAAWVAQFPGTEELQRLLHANEVVDGNPFFLQQRIPRSKFQVDNGLLALQQLGREMADPNTVIFPWSGYHCNWCSFKAPCDLLNRGEDIDALLDVKYAKRSFWEGDDDDDN